MNKKMLIVSVLLLISSLAIAEENEKRKVYVTKVASPFQDWQWSVLRTPNKSLGESCQAVPGAGVFAIADGRAIFAQTIEGDAHSPNWGGLVIQEVWLNYSDRILIAYGHIKIDAYLPLFIKQGVILSRGQRIGDVAARSTKENGGWETSRLRLQICLDPLKQYKDETALTLFAEKDPPNRGEDYLLPSKLFDFFKEEKSEEQLPVTAKMLIEHRKE